MTPQMTGAPESNTLESPEDPLKKIENLEKDISIQQRILHEIDMFFYKAFGASVLEYEPSLLEKSKIQILKTEYAEKQGALERSIAELNKQKDMFYQAGRVIAKAQQN